MKNDLKLPNKTTPLLRIEYHIWYTIWGLYGPLLPPYSCFFVVSLKKTSQFVFFGERVLSRPSSGRIHMLPSLFLKGLCETVPCWNYETRTTTNFRKTTILNDILRVIFNIKPPKKTKTRKLLFWSSIPFCFPLAKQDKSCGFSAVQKSYKNNYDNERRNRTKTY